MSAQRLNLSDVPVERGRRQWLPWAVLVAVVLVLGGVLVGVLIARDEDSAQASGTQQLASIKAACGLRRDSYTGSQAPPATWCSEVVGWMSNSLGGGHMMGTMMWANQDQMRDTCVPWMARANVPGGTDGWCDEMVTWMQQHMHVRDHWDRGWMMDGGSMMGG